MVGGVYMKEYESTITFKFKEHNWKLAQEANLHLLNVLRKGFKEFDMEIQCKKLKERE